jgi:aspartyl-tRNA(Asn)/glutamyl-tRNA(Gln) amidotransferase subunit C
MIIDENLLIRLENLSRLELSAEEREEMQALLSDMTESLGLLSELDTGDSLPTVNPLDFMLKNVLREDIVGSGADPAALVENSPRHKDGYFEVPKTLD